MKTKKILIALSLLSICFLWNCSEESISVQNSEILAPPPGGNGNGNGPPGDNGSGTNGGNGNNVEERYGITYSGDIITSDESFGFAEKDGNKYKVLSTVYCADWGYMASHMYGLETFGLNDGNNNPCYQNDECGGVNIRQIDVNKGSKRVISHFYVAGRDFRLKGDIEEKVDGKWTIFPTDTLIPVVVNFDSYRFAFRPGTDSGDPCVTESVDFPMSSNNKVTIRLLTPTEALDVCNENPCG